MSLISNNPADLTRWGSTRRPRGGRSDGGAALARLGLLLVGLLGAIVFANVAAADQVRLLDAAGATGDRVTLAQVAELEGDAAVALGDLVVYELARTQDHGTVTLKRVRQVLDHAEVNWARLSLKGFAACAITRVPAEKPVIEAPVKPIAANPVAPVTTEQPTVLAEVITAHLAGMLGVDVDELHVEFAERDRAALAAASLDGRLEIEPTNRRVLGRSTLRVRRYEGVELTQTMVFTAHVSRRALALVATEPVRRGEPIVEAEVELREALIDDDRVEPITDRSLVAGQTAARSLDAGQVITPQHLQPVLLVKRGQVVKVRSLAGALVVRVNALALEDGGRGDVVRVRNQTSREEFIVRVTGSREAMAVSDTEQENVE